jgi:hypothetical protein
MQSNLGKKIYFSNKFVLLVVFFTRVVHVFMVHIVYHNSKETLLEII